MTLKRKYTCRDCDEAFESDVETNTCPYENENEDEPGAHELSNPVFKCPFCDVWMDWVNSEEEWLECPACEVCYVDQYWEPDISIEAQITQTLERLEIYRKRIAP